MSEKRKKGTTLTSATLRKIEVVKAALLEDSASVTRVADARTVKKYLKYYFSKEDLLLIYNNQPDNRKVFLEEAKFYIYICSCVYLLLERVVQEISALRLILYCQKLEKRLVSFYYVDVRQYVKTESRLIYELLIYFSLEHLLNLQSLFYYRLTSVAIYFALTRVIRDNINQVLLAIILQEHLKKILVTWAVENVTVDEFFEIEVITINLLLLKNLLDYVISRQQSRDVYSLFKINEKEIARAEALQSSQLLRRRKRAALVYILNLCDDITNNVEFTRYYQLEIYFVLIRQKIFDEDICIDNNLRIIVYCFVDTVFEDRRPLVILDSPLFIKYVFYFE